VRHALVKKKVRKLMVRRHYSPKNDVTLFRGDCLALLRQIPDEAVQLVVTSPPYNVGKSYERRVSFDEYMTQQERVIAECVRIIKPGGSICWQAGHHVNGHAQVIPLDLAMHPVFEAYPSLRLRNRIIWHYAHGLNSTHRFSGRHETILWYTKGDDYTFNLDAVRVPQKYPGKRAYKGPKRGSYSGNPLGKNPGDVWTFPNVKGSHIEKTTHPCQFPVELPERLVLALTSPRDLVVDPYLGVGTSAVAAVMHGRRAAGAELVKEYLTIARRRTDEAAKGIVKHRLLGTPIFVPKPNSPLTISPFAVGTMAS
jgi:adenine-specific DNA-methyltransferase